MIFKRAISAAALGLAALMPVSDGAAADIGAATKSHDQEIGRQTTAIYWIYSHGLHVVDLRADYTLSDQGYGVHTTLHAGGLMSWLLRMNIDSVAQGYFAQGGVQPLSYESKGFSRGTHRSVVLHYADDVPHIIEVDPKEADREAVPEMELDHAMDTLSAVAYLLESVRRSGKCVGTARVFDGLRLTSMTSQGPVNDNVPTSFGQKFKGSALRCDFVGQQQAGFIKNSAHLAVEKAPHQGTAWFQDLPGIGLTVVRIEFEHPKLGPMIAVLNRAPILQP